MAAYRLGIAGKAARQFGSVAGHHTTPRTALTLCCVDAVDRLWDSAKSRGRNITLAATYSVLCAVEHKTDSATGEHGDLLDLITLNYNLSRITEAMDEARLFLAVPRPAIIASPAGANHATPAPGSSSDAARRLFRSGRPVPGTPAEAYLRARGITAPVDWPALRFHPSVYYRADQDSASERWPALLAAVIALDGTISGIQRTWLDRERPAKAPLPNPRRALGRLLGNGVRFGNPAQAGDIVAAGEGIETMLALKSVLPDLPMIAGLSANHLAALDLPSSLRRLYVARDNDAAGLMASERLHERHSSIDVRELVPLHDDFNRDLCRLGSEDLRARLADQLVPDDRPRLLTNRRLDPK
jgi:Toprim domain